MALCDFYLFTKLKLSFEEKLRDNLGHKRKFAEGVKEHAPIYLPKKIWKIESCAVIVVLNGVYFEGCKINLDGKIFFWGFYLIIIGTFYTNCIIQFLLFLACTHFKYHT